MQAQAPYTRPTPGSRAVPCKTRGGASTRRQQHPHLLRYARQLSAKLCEHWVLVRLDIALRCRARERQDRDGRAPAVAWAVPHQCTARPAHSPILAPRQDAEALAQSNWHNCSPRFIASCTAHLKGSGQQAQRGCLHHHARQLYNLLQDMAQEQLREELQPRHDWEARACGGRHASWRLHGLRLAGAGWRHADCLTCAVLPPPPAAVAAWTCLSRRWPRGRTRAGSRITVSACAWARRPHRTLQLLPRPRLMPPRPLLAALRLLPLPEVPLLLGAVPRLQNGQLAEGQLLLPLLLLLPALHPQPPAAAVHPPVALLPRRAQAGAPRLKAAAAAAAARCASAVVAAALRTAAL